MTPAEMQARINAVDGFLRDILRNGGPQWIVGEAAALMGVTLDDRREPAASGQEEHQETREAEG